MNNAFKTVLLFLSTAMASCQTTQERKIDELAEQAQIMYWQSQVSHNTDPKLTDQQREEIALMFENAAVIVTDQSADEYDLLNMSTSKLDGVIVKNGDTLATISYYRRYQIFDANTEKSTGIASEYYTRDVIDVPIGTLTNTYDNLHGSRPKDVKTETSTFTPK